MKPFVACSHVASACRCCALQPHIICHDAAANKKVSKLLICTHTAAVYMKKSMTFVHGSIDLYHALKQIHPPITRFSVNLHHKDFYRLRKVVKDW